MALTKGTCWTGGRPEPDGDGWSCLPTVVMSLGSLCMDRLSSLSVGGGDGVRLSVGTGVRHRLNGRRSSGSMGSSSRSAGTSSTRSPTVSSSPSLGRAMSASPLTFRLSAVFSRVVNCLWSTFTSPRYINSTRSRSSANCTSLSTTIGCRVGWSRNSALKYALHADNTTLWARIRRPSSEQASVTSTRDSSWSSWLKTPSRLFWWLFHRRQ